MKQGDSEKPLIGVNLVSIPEQKAGVGFLALNLFNTLIPKMPEKKFIVYVTEGVSLPGMEFKNAIIRQVPSMGHAHKILWEQFKFPSIIKKDSVTKIFNIHYTSLLLLPAAIPQITLVPDLTYIRHFFKRNLLKSFFIAVTLPFSLIKASHIISISKFTSQEILKFFPFVSPIKIRVMHLGLGMIDKNRPTVPEDVQVLSTFGVEQKKYFIFVGTVEPTKNIYRNLIAFAKVLETYPEYKFLVVGKRGWQDKKDKRFQKLRDFIEANKIEDSVIFTGYIKSRELDVLFGFAKCLVFTSLNEGFGIPLLEAMQKKIPIITSNMSSMPEVAGDAALYVDPYSSDEILDVMVKILSEEGLCNSLVEKGTVRLEQFSWEKAVEQIEDLI